VADSSMVMTGLIGGAGVMEEDVAGDTRVVAVLREDLVAGVGRGGRHVEVAADVTKALIICNLLLPLHFKVNRVCIAASRDVIKTSGRCF